MPPGSSKDWELVQRLRQGNEEAFEEFADAYFPALHRFALSRLHGDFELAREIVQRTLCKVVTKLETFRGESALFTWLCSCCRNEIAMHYRSQSRAPQTLPLDELTLREPATPDPGPELDAIGIEERQLVLIALDLLPRNYANALEWKYLEQLSVREIAQRLNLTPKAAESILTRARNAFRTTFLEITASDSSGATEEPEVGTKP